MSESLEVALAIKCSKVVDKIHRYEICNKSASWRSAIMGYIHKNDLDMAKYEPEWYLTLLRHYTEDVRHKKALQKKQQMKRLGKGKTPLSKKQQKVYNTSKNKD